MSHAIRHLSTVTKTFNLKGVYIPLVTPFTANGDIDFEKVEFNVKKYEKEATLSGYVVGGSNSEVAVLSPEERIDLVSRVRKLVNPQKSVIGGATSESTKQSYEMSQAMAAAGADAVLVLTPFYFKNKMTDDVIANHYVTLANKIPIPVIIYNNPNVSGINMSYKLLSKLAEHPNICGVKDSDIRKIGMTVLETKGKKFDISAASAGYLLPTLQMGGTSGIMALACLLAPEVCKLYDLTVENKINEALELQKRLIPPDILICGGMGITGLKYAMQLKGFEVGHCRLPLVDIKDEEKAEIKNVLKKYNFL
ncbi:4-hydroxy-2-oxoglutarate aldolase, mitochondrial-like [Lycorma delicatula]|uniref:4-hydroxy-2-oxoglutarate aldolase, mitochondrial-like n=1 Tax=Lycorma delicatula TaxID=130591 RepID=UPI003F5188A0